MTSTSINAIHHQKLDSLCYTMVLIIWQETVVLSRVKFVLRNVPVTLFTVLKNLLVIVKEAVPVGVPTQGHSARLTAVIRSQDTARYGRPHAVDGTVFARKAFPAKTFVRMNFLKWTVLLTLDDNEGMVFIFRSLVFDESSWTLMKKFWFPESIPGVNFMIHVSNAKYVISKVDFTSSFPVNN